MATATSSRAHWVGVVDDDESTRRAVARLLRAAGMSAVTYASAEALRADIEPPRFSCLVLDIQLPGMSGIELRNRLANEGSTTPVIFVTAHDDAATRDEALAGPCAGFFSKTDAGMGILNAIRRIVSLAPSRQ
jgi:FixJ family two-component response regulator